MLADKGYHTDDIRGELRTRGATAAIPTKRNRKLQYSVNRAVYAMRNRTERFFNRLKESRRGATRYHHTAESFLGFAKLTAIKIWIRFVHAT
jgi:transposase